MIVFLGRLIAWVVDFSVPYFVVPRVVDLSVFGNKKGQAY
jgi:hypothetical protein